MAGDVVTPEAAMSNHDDAARWRKVPVLKVAGPTPIGIAASTAACRSGRVLVLNGDMGQTARVRAA